MALIKDRRIIADSWRALRDDEGAPNDGPVLLSWQRWCDERAAWRGRAGPIGVRVSPEVRAGEIRPDLDRLALIALEFPKFGDGRPYTTARILRERYGYTGEIRAVGDVFRDQLAFMARCGFDAFEIKPGHDAGDALDGFGELSVAFQPAADGVPAALRRRRRARPGGAKN